MAKGTIATITKHHALGALLGWNFLDELNAPVFVHITSGVGESHIAVVILVENLRQKTN